MPRPERLPEAPHVSIRRSRSGVLLCDRKGKIERANATLHALLGCPEGSLVGKGIGQAFGGAPDAFSAILRLVRGSEAVRGDVTITGHDGRNHHCELLAVGWPSDDADTIQVTVTPTPGDQSERSEAEALADTLRLLTARFTDAHDLAMGQQWLSGVCQEVLIAAQAVSAYLELLMANVERPVASLSEIHSRLSRLSSSVGELSSLTVADPGAWQPQPELIDLEDVVEAAAAAVYCDALRRRQRLVIDITEETPTIRVDPRILRRLLTSLLAHAVRVTPPQGTITVSAHRGDSSWIVGVSDGGRRIEDSDLPHAFRPFAAFHSPAAWSDEAMGPELALVRQLVEALGGGIWIERPEEGGNTFFFSLVE